MTSTTPQTAASSASHERRHVVCQETEIPRGGRRIAEVDGRSIGIFNVDGRFYALHNGCPHKGGALCEGPICGTTLPTKSRTFSYGREGQIVRCAWHGWEFDITTGSALADPGVHARTYRVDVRDGNVVVIV